MPKPANPAPSAPKQGDSPEWANGLQQLYKSVVDEPLPDSFKDLLSKLDDAD
ncbi:MAG: NepR family anti-sigma factor [Parerythrobacter sp.]